MTGTAMYGILVNNTLLNDTLLDGATVPALLDLSGMASTMAIILAAIFAFAAVSKLLAPETTVSEFAELGVPSPALAAKVVPVLEIGAAVALLVSPPAGALAAVALLMAFTAVIVTVVRSGRSVACGCLGAMSRQPVSNATVARNVALIAMAAIAGSAPSLTVPNFAAIAASTSLILLTALAMQLMVIRNTLGRIWSVELAGEQSKAHSKTKINVRGVSA
ncbi:MAG: MauE/DoxX family redox-associated membrane protein [Acidimicrobiales bacterium]